MLYTTNIFEVLFLLKSVVENFQIKNAKGKRVHMFDQLDTRVNDDDLLKYLIRSKTENFMLKVQIMGTSSSTKDLFTSKVFLHIFS